jgi:hypothetical protein
MVMVFLLLSVESPHDIRLSTRKIVRKCEKRDMTSSRRIRNGVKNPG